MLLGGDEMGRTQLGNNNAYCQDNEISWFDWAQSDQVLLDFTRRLIHFRQQHPVFRRHRWFQGRSIRGSELADIAWFRPDAVQMSDADWQTSFAKALQVFFNGGQGADPGPHGEPVRDESFLLLFNADSADVEFVVPSEQFGGRWQTVVDTGAGSVLSGEIRQPGGLVRLYGRSLLILKQIG